MDGSIFAIMEKLIVHIDDKKNVSRIKEALKLFKGVKRVSDKLTKKDYEDLENISILKAIKAGRKTPKVKESEIKKALK